MRTTFLSLGVLALVSIVTSTPVSAQMCGGGRQAQASAPAAQAGMCGMGQTAADDPMADKSPQAPTSSGMCPCCKNMAMMKSGMTNGHKNMPGMEMPKQ